MRNLKFRAWDKINQWMDDDFFIYAESGQVYDHASRTYNTPNTEIEKSSDFTIMQSTGLKDKNNTGVELFEGDIVYIAGVGNCKVVICPLYGVSFSNNGAMDGNYIDSLVEGDIGELLGNIHSNPELLEQQL